MVQFIFVIHVAVYDPIAFMPLLINQLVPSLYDVTFFSSELSLWISGMQMSGSLTNADGVIHADLIPMVSEISISDRMIFSLPCVSIHQ